MKKHKASISHDDAIVEELRQSPEFAAEYLKAALEDRDEPRVLLIAMRHVAEARGGIAKVAKVFQLAWSCYGCAQDGIEIKQTLAVVTDNN